VASVLPSHGGLGIQNPSLTYSAAFVSSSLAEISGAFSRSGETSDPTPEVWASARELQSPVESTPLSQWIAL